MINKVILVGNLGQDPETRHTNGGNSVTQLRLATTEKYKDRDGNMQERTEWHTVIVWGKQGEACGKHLTKGRQVYVEGRLTTRKWQDKEGKDRYTTEVIGDNVRFLGQGQRENDKAQPLPTDDLGYGNGPW
jgi:single-strand DNA-binding protein